MTIFFVVVSCISDMFFFSFSLISCMQVEVLTYVYGFFCLSLYLNASCLFTCLFNKKKMHTSSVFLYTPFCTNNTFNILIYHSFLHRISVLFAIYRWWNIDSFQRVFEELISMSCSYFRESGYFIVDIWQRLQYLYVHIFTDG